MPPLPHQIFAPGAEVVLPQALTASQLFGIERVTGIELEAAAGIGGLSSLFLRWLGACVCTTTTLLTGLYYLLSSVVFEWDFSKHFYLLPNNLKQIHTNSPACQL